MEVLLLQDVAGIGKKNDLLVVGDGFALNHLLPQRKALVATPTVRKRYADQIKRRAEEKEREKQVQMNLAAALQGKQVQIAGKVTKTGKLYAGVSEKMIVEALREQHGIEIPASALLLSEHIKTTGAVQVPVKMGSGSFALTVVVSAKEEKPKARVKKAA